MVQAVQEIPGQERHGYRYTGFSEPLSLERNTTWAHPEADTSANPVLESASFQLTRTNSRLRSLAHRSHSQSTASKHTIRGRLPRVGTNSTSNPLANLSSSRGSSQLVLDPSDMYKDIVYEDGSREPSSSGGLAESKREISSADSGVGMGSLELGTNWSNEPRDDGESVKGKKKRRGLFGKLQKSRS